MEVGIVVVYLNLFLKRVEETVMLHFPKSHLLRVSVDKVHLSMSLLDGKGLCLISFIFSLWFMYVAFKNSLCIPYEGEICHFHSCFQECRVSLMVNTPCGMQQYRLSHSQCPAKNTEKEHLLFFWCLPGDVNASKWKNAVENFSGKMHWKMYPIYPWHNLPDPFDSTSATISMRK